VLAVLLFTVPASARFYEAQDYDVRLQLDHSGTLTVTETIAFRFIAGPFHYAFREIAANHTDGISDVHATMDGRDCPIGTGPGEVEIYGSPEMMVRWHFPEIISGNHKFTVQYRVAGVIRPGPNSQMLVWRALPQNHEYPIRSTEIILEYPPEAAPRAAAIRSTNITFTSEAGHSVLNMNNPDKDVVVDAIFPAGSFDAPTPQWLLAREQSQRNYASGARIGRIVAAAILILSYVWLFRVRVAAPLAPSEVTITSPPNSLPPALVASLIRKPGASLGTLFDLARRGVLKIEETKRSVWLGRKFQIVYNPASQSLAPHESTFLQLGFGPGETSAGLRGFLGRVGRPRKFRKALRDELRSTGCIDPAREAAGRKLSIAALVGFIAGVAMLTMESRWGFALPIGAALLAIALLAIILAARQPIWTDAGIFAAGQWKAFSRYVRDLAKGRELLPDAADFERFLPYAAAFGLASQFLKQRSQQGGVELPPWFHAIETADASDAFVAFVSTGDATASGDGGFGGGGGGDASGGGSSGAG